MNNQVTGILFITAGLFFLFHDYYAGPSEGGEKNGGELKAADLIMGFFMLGLGGYYLFRAD